MNKATALNEFIERNNLSGKYVLIDFETEFKDFLRQNSGSIIVKTQSGQDITTTDVTSSAKHTKKLIKDNQITDTTFEYDASTRTSYVVIGSPASIPIDDNSYGTPSNLAGCGVAIIVALILLVLIDFIFPDLGDSLKEKLMEILNTISLGLFTLGLLSYVISFFFHLNTVKYLGYLVGSSVGLQCIVQFLATGNVALFAVGLIFLVTTGVAIKFHNS